MLASRSSVRFANDLERPASKHCSRGRKLPDRCQRAKTRNERDQQANHPLGKFAVVRYTCPAEAPTRQVGFSLPLALRDSEGRSRHRIPSAMDISDSKINTEKLKESEEKL